MALLDDEDYIWMDDAYVHNTEVVVAGTTFARTIEFINSWSVQFTPDTQWTVRLAGSNNNIFDVENGILVQNQVQVISTNSAGLINVDLATLQTSVDDVEAKVDIIDTNVDDIETEVDRLVDHVIGGREIDFTGSDALGWQRIERNEAGAIVQRYNLFDEDGTRITGTVQQFVQNQKMIAQETPV
jgi:hypothetical protein